MWPRLVRFSLVGLSLFAGLLGFQVGSDDGPVTAKDEAFRYVTPDAGQPFDHPPLMAISLSAEKPTDLTEAVEYRGATRRYGQLRFGTPNSQRVTIVVDEREKRQFDLYVDANRDFRIEARDRVAGDGASRRMHAVEGGDSARRRG